MRLGRILAALAAVAAAAAPARSQDVELLSRIYGTPLPRGYVALKARDPDAFRFEHGRAARVRQRLRALGGIPTVRAEAPSLLAPREGAVQGTFRLPVVLGLFSDSPVGRVPFSAGAIRDAYFGAGPGTIKAYYGEVSGGRVTLEGDVQDWVRTGSTQAAATGGESGLVPGTVGPFIVQILEGLPAVDWGAYDNDGPDGLPNSGDDDGYVDALAVLHPTAGAECTRTDSKTRIWSHKWSLAYAAGSVFTTSTASANGGFIRVDDYFIQPVYNCAGSALNEIGIFTHEAGHAFGLPDLYDTFDGDGRHAGAGNWDLMATGAWGCDGRSPSSPCHLGAWSKAMLGWVDVVALDGGRDLGTLTLPPVETGGTVYHVSAGDGSGQYYLLENRQRAGFDAYLLGTGLLIWQIDPGLVAERWAQNTVNAHDRLGVWLRQADGRGELESVGGDRGDGGDPYPFVGIGASNHVFHAGSNPASRSHDGTASGVTLLDIQRGGQDVVLHALTSFTTVTVRTEGGSGTEDLLAIDGTAIPGPSTTYVAAPFEQHEVAASAGESLGPGVRRPFVGWDDDPSAARVRMLDTPLEDVTLTALYSGRQVELAMDVLGGVNGVVPGTFSSVPASEDLWFSEGVTASVQAVPSRGFDFREWSGVLAGQPNPGTVTMDGPTSAGASFELTYRLPAGPVTISAAEPQNRLLAPENGTAPYTWTVESGELARGLALDANGRLTGVALETGTWELQVEVRDALGLTTRGVFGLRVDAPVIPVAQLGAPFLGTGPSLTPAQERFLDEQGNRSGAYDLGDFRAWVLANPGVILSAPLRALVAEDPEGGR